MVDLPFVGRVVNLLRDGGIDITVFDQCEPNPRAVTCDPGRRSGVGDTWKNSIWMP